MSELNEKQQAIMTLLGEHNEPLTHGQLVQMLTPWYNEPGRFKASVSSCLGVLRSKRLIIAKNMPTGRTAFVPGRGRIEVTKRGWLIKRPRCPIGGVVTGFSRGGLVGEHSQPFPLMRDYQQILLDKVAEGLGVTPVELLAEREKSTRSREITITMSAVTGASLNPKGLEFRDPITDDMCAMLDDINRVEETPARRYARTYHGAMGRMRRMFADYADRTMRSAIRGEMAS